MRFTSSSGSTDQPYADGERIAVLSDPDHPEQAQIAAFSTLWLVPAVLDAIGLFLTGLVVSLWFVLRRSPRPQA